MDKEKTCVELKQEELIKRIYCEINKNLKEYKSTDEAKYGCCPKCGYKLEPVWYEEPEDEALYIRECGKQKGYTGRYHKAVDYLLCECCGHRECTDGSFDDRYYYRKDN